MIDQLREGYEAYHQGLPPTKNPYSYHWQPGKHTDWSDGYFEGQKEGPPRNIPPEPVKVAEEEYDAVTDSIFEGYGSISYT